MADEERTERFICPPCVDGRHALLACVNTSDHKPLPWPCWCTTCGLGRARPARVEQEHRSTW